MQIGPRPAYEDRGFSPGFTSIRPMTSGFFGQSIPTISNWAVIDQSTPDANSHNPPTIEAYSDTNNTYEGSMNSTKTILIFDSPLTAETQFILNLIGTGTAEYNMTCTSPEPVNLVGYLRIIPFTTLPVANYASIVTWNSFIGSPPGLGTPAEIQFSATMDSGGTVEQFGINAFWNTALISDVGALGCVIDVKTVAGRQSGGSLPGLTVIAQFSNLVAVEKIYGISVPS